MVIRYTRFGLDTCTGQKINERCLELSLASLEIITNQNTLLYLRLSQPLYKILRRTIDKDTFLLYGSNSKDSRGGDFLMTYLDRMKQVFKSIINSLNFQRKPFCIGSPQYNHFV